MENSKSNDAQQMRKGVEPEFSLHLEPETVVDRIIEAIGTVLAVIGKASEGI
jgi:hypothetical protein